MKLFLMLLFLPVMALAEEMPSYLKDGVITVTLKDGKQYTFQANDWKVVPRVSEPEQVIHLGGAAEPAMEPQVLEQHKNRVRLLGGYGPNGLNTSRGANAATVSTSHGAVGGVGYDRLLNERWSVGGQMLNNDTYLLDVGFDF
jgi:hypothetical protein